MMNTPLLKTAIRVWLMEILVSGFNFFVLMNLVYEPRWGVLIAHQIGMLTRIVYIFVFAYCLQRFIKAFDRRDLLHVGVLWLVLTLVFEWVGSLAIGRPVEEILIGWNVLAGYMWPYVLLTYLFSNLIVGTIMQWAFNLDGRGESNFNGDLQVEKILRTVLILNHFELRFSLTECGGV